jgi:hypothetical protein
LIAVAEAEFRYSDLLPTGADDTPYRLDLVAQGAQNPAVRLRVRLLVAGFGGIEDAEDALPELRALHLYEPFPRHVPYVSDYSPECVEGEFPEVHIHDPA